MLMMECVEIWKIARTELNLGGIVFCYYGWVGVNNRPKKRIK